MTMTQILRKAQRHREFSAAWVKFREVKAGRTRLNNTPIIRSVSYSTHNRNGERKHTTPNEYVSTIEIVGKHVVLSCSCDDFWAVWEVALAAQGAARVEYSNGQRPIDRNPTMIPGCCKHLFRLGSRLLEKNKL